MVVDDLVGGIERKVSVSVAERCQALDDYTLGCGEEMLRRHYEPS